MDFYFEDRRIVPAQSALKKREELVALPLSTSVKVAMLNAMVGSKTRPGDLAKSMGVRPQEVTRILDLRHATKSDTLAEAFCALGLGLDLAGEVTPVGDPYGGRGGFAIRLAIRLCIHSLQSGGWKPGSLGRLSPSGPC